MRCNIFMADFGCTQGVLCAARGREWIREEGGMSSVGFQWDLFRPIYRMFRNRATDDAAPLRVGVAGSAEVLDAAEASVLAGSAEGGTVRKRKTEKEFWAEIH